MTNPINRINELRLKVRDGISITKEEAAEAVQLMREQRESIMNAQTVKDAKKAPANLNDLFD